jgi:fructokinase
MFTTNSRRMARMDILCAGELLMDLISTDFAEHFDQVAAYRPLPGGSPANLCMNMSRLGNRTALACSLGNDDMGNFLRQTVEKLGIDCSRVRRADVPTTLILVTRSRQVANFEAYRLADRYILPDQLDAASSGDFSIFHTTCFALSMEPAQSSIMEFARSASQRGKQLSIDLNYAQKIWPDRAQALHIVSEFCLLGALVKVSEVDWERLYGKALTAPEEACDHFISLGAGAVCVTLGGEGAWVASTAERHFLPARPVEVADTTGAGDAFWSGFLTAWLDGYGLSDCAKAARRMAELKIGTFGSLPNVVEKQIIYEDIE